MALPLKNEWTFSFSGTPNDADQVDDYRACFKEMCTFTTVQQFLDFYQFTQKALDVPQKTGYCLMKKGVLPMFEDETHAKQPSIRIRFVTNELEDLDKLWDYLIMGVLQGVFSKDFFTGIETRKNDRGQFCAVWIVGDATKQNQAKKILTDFLALPETFQLNIQRPKAQ